MDLFPEMFGGTAGLTAVQYASGICDQTPANNSVIQLANPSMTGTGQLINAKLLTLVGIVVWGAQAAAANVSVWASSVVNTVAGAADSGPVWLDHRRSLGGQADVPVGLLTKGNVALIAPIPNSTEEMRFVLAAAQVAPFKLPWNQDISPGTSALISVAGAARSVVSLIWIERQMTS